VKKTRQNNRVFKQQCGADLVAGAAVKALRHITVYAVPHSPNDG
jgi:hypothetical protein